MPCELFPEESAQPWTTGEGIADPSASAVEGQGLSQGDQLGWGKRCQGLAWKAAGGREGSLGGKSPSPLGLHGKELRLDDQKNFLGPDLNMACPLPVPESLAAP